MADTTIPVSFDVKEELEHMKNEHESWNAFLMRLANGHTELTEERVEEIVEEKLES